MKVDGCAFVCARPSQNEMPHFSLACAGLTYVGARSLTSATYVAKVSNNLSKVQCAKPLTSVYLLATIKE